MSMQCLPARLRLWLIIVTVLAMGCTALAPIPSVQQPVFLQPESPLASYDYATLTQNRWRVIEMMIQGEVVTFPALGVISIDFDPMGLLGITAQNCNTNVYQTTINAEGQYQLLPVSATGQGCGEQGNQQYHQLQEAIGMTTTFGRWGEQWL